MSSTEFDLATLDFAKLVGSDGPIAVEGARTRWGVGGPLDSEARIVKAPAGIVTYQPEEMTVRVRAGTSVEELNAALLEKGQRVPLPDRGGTVGGAIAVGENHPHMLGLGAIRTSLLQITYVSAEGKIVKGGGPTVKNVSGFDIPRLMVGSLGTLGLFSDMILRTNPIPSAARWVSTTTIAPLQVRDLVHAPGAIFWDGTTTWLLLEGHEGDIEASLNALRNVGDIDGADGPPELGSNRWSLQPDQLISPPVADYVAAIGTGLLFADATQPARSLAPPVAAVHERLAANFDPTNRLNPGRNPGVR